jgi:hypothetical protein
MECTGGRGDIAMGGHQNADRDDGRQTSDGRGSSSAEGVQQRVRQSGRTAQLLAQSGVAANVDLRKSPLVVPYVIGREVVVTHQHTDYSLVVSFLQHLFSKPAVG